MAAMPSNGSMPGYGHAGYAASLSEYGSPRSLAACDGWILKRAIPGTPFFDGMGCYPLFACRDWSRLPGDLTGCAEELVSLVLVTDPFGDYTRETLSHTFPDLIVPFKTHYVVDLSAAAETYVHSHHQRYARKALAAVSIDTSATAGCREDEWAALYDNLIARHNIRGIARFSAASFAQQLAVPGALILRARQGEHTVGMTWWFLAGGVGYYHLGAYTDAGYQLRASFALFWRSIELLKAKGLRWLDLGAGAGLGDSGVDGLSRFKRGWSNDTRVAYLCGRVFDRGRYNQIASAKGIHTTQYFPAYRLGEFS
jgi:hypothetical protein